jgi:hypothetical protein
MKSDCERCRLFIEKPDCNNCKHCELSEKEKGLYSKYYVKKISNPDKKIDCIVLEFDDPIGRVGIKAWANECEKQGYLNLSKDILEKLKQFDIKEAG